MYLVSLSSLQINGKRVPAEVYLQNKAQHRRVIEIYEHFETEDYFVYVMERPKSCQDLRDGLHHNGPFTEKKTKCYFHLIIEANINSEEKGVLHRVLRICYWISAEHFNIANKGF